MADVPELWEDEPGEWLGGFLHPGWQIGWRRLVVALRWANARVSWPMAAMFPVGVALTFAVRALGGVEGFENTVPVLLSVVGAVVGAGGFVFGALRFNRDEARVVVSTQQSVLDDAWRVNQELCAKLEREREERVRLRAELGSVVGPPGGK